MPFDPDNPFLDRDRAVRPPATSSSYNPMASSAAATTLYTTGTPEQIAAAVKAGSHKTGGFGMGFFDDVFSAVGDVASSAGHIIDSVPGLRDVIPFGDVISQAGSLARGGISGLAGNLVGRAQQILPAAATILGLPPQVGQLGSSLLGRLQSAPAGGGFTGRNPAGLYGQPGYIDPTTGMTVGARPNPVLSAPPLPTSIALREPRMQTILPGRTQTSFSIGGPSGVSYLSTDFTGGGSPAIGNVGGGSCSSSPLYFGNTRGQLLRAASANAGFRITWKKLLYILLHFGIEVAKRFTQLDESAILWLYTTRPHRGRRGPHLRTIAKRARQVQGYRHSIARIARILGAVRHSRAPAGPTRHRRRSSRR